MKKIIFILSIISLISCNKSKETNKSSFLKTVLFNEEKFTELIIKKQDSTNLILLETNKKSLINSITRLYFTQSKIIVYDAHGKNVFLFSSQGKFIRKIGNKGKGANEYIQLTNMFFDKKNEQIEIFDNPRKTMLIYDINGNLIETKKSDISFISFIKSPEGYFVYSPFVHHPNSKGYNLFLLDENLKLTKNKFLRTKNNFDRALFTENFTQNNSELFFRHGLNDTIYKIANNKVDPYLHIDFGKFKVPYSKVSKMRNQKRFDENVYFNTPNYLGKINNVLINNKSLTFCFSKVKLGESPFYSGSYNRLTDSINFYNSFTIKMAGVSSVYPKYIDNHKIVYVTNMEELGSNELSFLEKKYKIKIKENSNPLLLISYE